MKRERSITEDALLRSAATGALPRRELIRRGWRAGLGLAAVATLGLTPRSGFAAPASGSSIPPNCIYVCCDGTCDSWKMCMQCVKWPKGTTTAAK